MVRMAQGTPAGGGATIALVAQVLTEAVPSRGVPSSYYCHSIVVVNPASTPVAVRLELAGLLAGSGLPLAHPVERLQAQRLFNGQYATNFSRGAAGGDTAVLQDLMDARAANVYRVGCAVPEDPSNLIVHGSIEALADPGAPGRLLLGGIRFLATNTTDDRVRLTVSTEAPYEGRYAAKLNLAQTAAPVVVQLPIQTALDAAAISNSKSTSTSFASAGLVFSVWVRSSPPGATVALPAGQAQVEAGVEWTELRTTLANVSHAGAPAYPVVELSIQAAVPTSVWIDGASLRPAFRAPYVGPGRGHK